MDGNEVVREGMRGNEREEMRTRRKERWGRRQKKQRDRETEKKRRGTRGPGWVKARIMKKGGKNRDELLVHLLEAIGE